MSEDRITVTVTDHKTGESETQELRRDSYVLVVGQHMELAGETRHCNGTRQLTLKRRKDTP